MFDSFLARPDLRAIARVPTEPVAEVHRALSVADRPVLALFVNSISRQVVMIITHTVFPPILLIGIVMIGQLSLASEAAIELLEIEKMPRTLNLPLTSTEIAVMNPIKSPVERAKI